MATLIGIGWKQLSYKVWAIDMGAMVDVIETIPYMVKHKIYDTVERRLWLTSSLALDDEVHLHTDSACDDRDRPFWYPLRSVVLGRDKIIGGATRSVAANTQWDQCRLADTNYVDEQDRLCRACGEQEGNLVHRHHPRGCRAMQPFVEEYLGEEAISYWDSKQPSFLVKHGIMMRRDLPECPEANATEDQYKVLYPDKELVFTNFSYTDGSGKPCRFVPHLGCAG